MTHRDGLGRGGVLQEPGPSSRCGGFGQAFEGVIERKKVRRLSSRDQVSVDGTPIEAWAPVKPFRPKDGGGGSAPGPGRNGERDFHGEKRSNESHESTAGPAARLYRKGDGKENRLCYMGHALMENRDGLLVFRL